MSTVRYSFAILILSLAVLVCNVSASAALPDTAVPNGVQADEGPSGGRIIHGSLSGVASGAGAFTACLHHVGAYFSGSLKLLKAVRSKNGSVTLCAFSTALHRTAVSGIIVSSYAANGASRFAAVFDEPQNLRNSLSPMLEQVNTIAQASLDRVKPAGNGPPADFARYEAASHHVALTREPYQDGTATIGIAPGFTPQMMASGQFLASASDGANIKLYMPVSLLDPNGSLYQMETSMARNSGGGLPAGQVVVPYTTDPVSAWKQFLTENARQNNAPYPDPQIQSSREMQGVAGGWTGRLVTGTATIKGKAFVFTGSLVVSPPAGPDGGWLLQVTLLGAPAERAAADMPEMIAMQRSETVDTNALRDQTMRNIAIINAQCASWLASNKIAGDAARDAVYQRSMDDAKSAQDTMTRTAAGFIGYINDTSVVMNSQTGVSSTVNSGLASSMTNSNPSVYSVVPVSQYKPGVNY